MLLMCFMFIFIDRVSCSLTVCVFCVWQALEDQLQELQECAAAVLSAGLGGDNQVCWQTRSDTQCCHQVLRRVYRVSCTHRRCDWTW